MDDLQFPSPPYFPAYAQGQGPPPMVQERFQSVISQLFHHSIIRCGGALDDDMTNIIVAELLYLDVVDPKKAAGHSEILKLRKMLEDDAHQKEKLEGDIATLHSQLLQLSFEADEIKKQRSSGIRNGLHK